MVETMDRRRFTGLSLAGTAGLAGLAGCATPDPLGEDLPGMGSFQLASAITVSKNAKKIPPSRSTTPEALESVMNAEVKRRFGRYQGGKLFYIAINIDGYSLAPPGIPIVLTPKSIMVISANVWTAQPVAKIGGPEQITTFEGADTLFLGSGLVKDADEQLLTLCRNSVKKVQSWMLRNPEWFDLPA